jgi:hypothetical protein
VFLPLLPPLYFMTTSDAIYYSLIGTAVFIFLSISFGYLFGFISSRNINCPHCKISESEPKISGWVHCLKCDCVFFYKEKRDGVFNFRQQRWANQYRCERSRNRRIEEGNFGGNRIYASLSDAYFAQRLYPNPLVWNTILRPSKNRYRDCAWYFE